MKKLNTIEPQSTAKRVANALREQILSEQDGAYLGSETTLAEMLGVSSPTFRQAASMLEHEQLLQIKPGKGGGYFVRQPDIETVTDSAALFLRNHELSNDNVHDAVDAIFDPVVRAAIECDDKELIAALQKFRDDKSSASGNRLDIVDSRRDSATLAALLAQMSGNLLYELFLRILFNEINLSKMAVHHIITDEYIAVVVKLRIEIADAVLAKDLDRAIAALKTRSNYYRNWPLDQTK